MDEPAGDLLPILAAHLFPQIEGRLIELLRSLSAEEWQAQTVSPQWKVKDVAAHLLDTQLRKLSLARDGYVPKLPADDSPFGLAALINRLNREGVTVYGRLSPPALIELMELASGRSAEFHQSLDPFARAAFSVSWVGEEASKNWFDTAREIHRALAPSAANPAGDWTPGHHDARALPSGVGLFPAGAPPRISECAGGEWHAAASGHRGRLRRHVAAVARARSLAFGRCISNRAGVPREHPAGKLRGAFLPKASTGRRQKQVRVEGDRRMA